MELNYYKCNISKYSNDIFLIPKNYKQIFASNIKIDNKTTAEAKELIADINDIFSTGMTRENYIRFFHTLLWFEETILRINLKVYNRQGVHLKQGDNWYSLTVSGLAEKRPSLLVGDYMYIIPQKAQECIFEAAVHNISGTTVCLMGLHRDFEKHYDVGAKFDVRFIYNRTPMERMHRAVHNVRDERQESRIFPQVSKKTKNIHPITSFFNSMVANNLEQRIAVENIVGKSNGRAPFLIHGPPGTGKTVTVVEAILQVVYKSARHRVLVCTDSNMAADHLTACLIKYKKHFTTEKFLLRVCSRFRAWETLPETVAPYCNGTSFDDFTEVSIKDFKSYNIVIVTLSHASTFAMRLKAERLQKYISHLFIDEAAQASEPMSLVPISGLLSVSGTLVLAGDPSQLGPIIISQSAKYKGLGLSLMERLQTTVPMYQDRNPNYIVMLKTNFRSNNDILLIPNELFYNNELNAKAADDPISTTDLHHDGRKSRAIIFHGILSKEQRTKASPSFFNSMELDIVRNYVTILLHNHKVKQEDIGIVTPYILQATKVKAWLMEQSYDSIEVGTVEAFQGKEKRIIIISTVRANSNLLGHDLKYQLGFLVDDKRFNVALTRAMAKVIVIGNPVCLRKDAKWRQYIDLCVQFGTYYGDECADD